MGNKKVVSTFCRHEKFGLIFRGSFFQKVKIDQRSLEPRKFKNDSIQSKLKNNCKFEIAALFHHPCVAHTKKGPKSGSS